MPHQPTWPRNVALGARARWSSPAARGRPLRAGAQRGRATLIAGELETAARAAVRRARPRSKAQQRRAVDRSRELRPPPARADGRPRTHLRRAGRRGRGRRRASMSRPRPAVDFDTLTFDDVTRNFGRRRALNRVSLTCRAGEIVALLGPNGAGKSTLLAIAATLLAPRRGGALRRRSPRAGGGAALRARIGLLGHDLFSIRSSPPRENLRFFGRLYGLPDVERARRGGARRAPVSRPRATTGASASRAACASASRIERALLHAPRLVLLDEPFTGLDDAAIGGAARAARQRCAARAPSCCMTTHDFEAIETLVDRALSCSIGGRLTPLDDGAGRLCATRYRRAMAAIMSFLRTVLARDAQGSAGRGAQPRDPLHDAVLRGVVRAGVLVRVRPEGAADRRTRPPASSGSRSRSPARWRSAARSSASARARRCGRC